MKDKRRETRKARQKRRQIQKHNEPEATFKGGEVSEGRNKPFLSRLLQDTIVAFFLGLLG